MKITVNHDELAQLESLLPESAKELIHVLGYAATARLITRFGGVTLSAKSGAAKERTGGVHALLREVLTDEQSRELIAYLGAAQFYIPRCDAALKELRNLRFIAEVAKMQQAGHSLRKTLALLCPEYGFSDRRGWELISAKCGATTEQKRLFD